MGSGGHVLTWVRSTSLPLRVGCVSRARNCAMSSQRRLCSSLAASALCCSSSRLSSITS